MNKKITISITLVLLLTIMVSLPLVNAECVDCHSKTSKKFMHSEMEEEVDCIDCHRGNESHYELDIKRTPQAEDCKECHKQEVLSFNEGKHSLGWEAMNTVFNATDRKVPHAAVGDGCQNCHKIGKGSGRCDVCHIDHRFSLETAKSPETCGTCHSGSHPQYAVWQNSKHGQIYQATNNESIAPSCQSCHMSEGHGVKTAWGFLGIRGEAENQLWGEYREEVKKITEWLGPINAPDVQRDTLEDWRNEREEMVNNCEECHTEEFAEKELKQSDEVLFISDNMTAKGVKALELLEGFGMISEKKKISLARQMLDHRFSAYMGAFHKSAEYSWDYGILKLQEDLVDLKEEINTFIMYAIGALVLVISLIFSSVTFYRSYK